MDDVGNPVGRKAGIQPSSPIERCPLRGIFAGRIDFATSVKIFMFNEPSIKSLGNRECPDSAGRFQWVAADAYFERFDKGTHALAARDRAVKRGDRPDFVPERSQCLAEGYRSIPQPARFGPRSKFGSNEKDFHRSGKGVARSADAVEQRDTSNQDAKSRNHGDVAGQIVHGAQRRKANLPVLDAIPIAVE